MKLFKKLNNLSYKKLSAAIFLPKIRLDVFRIRSSVAYILQKFD